MAGGKETPRQRMIGILYLVLLGLIALNVPESLLDAFKNIKDSLDQSTKNVSTSLQTTYAAFEAKKKDQPEKAAALEAQARKASAVTGDLDKYITNLRAYLVHQGGDINPTINDVANRDNLDIAPHVMIDGKRADTLREKVENTRKQLLAILGPKLSKDINFSLNATDPTPRTGETRKNWQEAYFGEGIPLGAVLTTLAKVQADNKNAENEVVKKILGQIDVAQVTLNTFQAIAVPSSDYVLQGQTYTAQIYLGAYDKNSNPTITVNNRPVPTSAGVGTYSTTAEGEGLQTWTGKLLVKQVEGPPKEYTVTKQYMVAKPSAVVSPDKMNVFYIGVPNPVSVSAPGVPKDKIGVSMTGGSITGSGGHYTVMVRSTGTAKVTITGEKGIKLGETDFRVKRIPDPKPQFAGKSGGNTSAANIKAQDKVFAKLDNFDFDAKFNVTRFTLLVIKPRQDPLTFTSSGSELTSAMKSAISSIGPGATIVFKDIVAVGPDGTQRGLDPIVLSAN